MRPKPLIATLTAMGKPPKYSAFSAPEERSDAYNYIIIVPHHIGNEKPLFVKYHILLINKGEIIRSQRDIPEKRRAVQLFGAAKGLQHRGGDVGEGFALAQVHALLQAQAPHQDRKSTRLNSSHRTTSRMPSSA